MDENSTTQLEVENTDQELNTQVLDDTDSLLDELLADTPSEFSVDDVAEIFPNREEADNFFSQFPMAIMNYWANNDKIIHIVTPVGFSEKVKSLILNTKIEGVPELLQNTFDQLKSIIQFAEVPDEQYIRVITLKQAINAQELMSAYQWSNSVGFNRGTDLYDELNKRGLVIQPTMEELRILSLIDLLLDVRTNAASKIINPSGSRIPAILRN